jgi:hypothetical protein
MCITEGDTIFFNVDAENGNYPVYLKDSKLNNNPNYDYSGFTKLEELINKGVAV